MILITARSCPGQRFIRDLILEKVQNAGMDPRLMLCMLKYFTDVILLLLVINCDDMSLRSRIFPFVRSLTFLARLFFNAGSFHVQTLGLSFGFDYR